MTNLSTSYSVETLPKGMYLVQSIDTAVTSMTVSYVPKAMTKGIVVIDEGLSTEERVGWNGTLDNGDGTATFQNLTRGMSPYKNDFSGDSALAQPHTGN